jgi:hypothetical protein
MCDCKKTSSLIHNKCDLAEFTSFSESIGTNLVIQKIRDTEIERAEPFLGIELVTAMRSVYSKSVKVYDQFKTYAIGDFVISSENEDSTLNSVYRCIQVGNGQPLTNVLYWEISPIGTFWYQHVRPWASFATYEHFCVGHGINVVEAGMRVSQTDTDYEINEAQRAKIIADAARSASIRKARLSKYLDSIAWTIGGVVYKEDNTCGKNSGNKPTHMRIWGAGKTNCR